LRNTGRLHPSLMPRNSPGRQITGTTAERPQLKKLMAVLAPGDVVIIPAVDRLSRDTTDLMVIASDMQLSGAGLRLWRSFLRVLTVAIAS
jgi:uncharacterized membrane-anchored protein